MGITYIDGTARGPTGIEVQVHFLVDSGATYSLIPAPAWQTIGLQPTRDVAFTLARRDHYRPTGIRECYLTLPQGQGHSPVILGEPGDEALLCVVTLEILGLVFNPFNRTLQPMRMLLA